MGPLQLLLCLLCAGILKSASQHLRMINITEAEANRTCSDQTMKLITLYDDDDVKFVTSYNIDMGVFVGLYKRENKTGLDYPICPTNGSETKDCSEELNFVCENGSFSDVKLNWCSARQYCHYHLLGDLATDEDKINLSKPVRIWIGGNRTDDWWWEDGGCSVFSRNWSENLTDGDIFASLKDGELRPQSADPLLQSVCSKGDFRIVVVNNTRLTWEGALEYCDRRHSGLLQIHSAEDQAAVQDWLNGTQYEGTFWVGLRQSRVFGFWIWKDRMVNHSNWENGSHPEMPLSHPCGVIEAPPYKWKDYNCLYPLPFICEERIIRLNKTNKM